MKLLRITTISIIILTSLFFIPNALVNLKNIEDNLDISMYNKEIEKIKKDTYINHLRLKKIREDINKVQNIIDSSSFAEDFELLRKIGKYVDLQNKKDLKKIKIISQNTGFDLEKSAIILFYKKTLDIPDLSIIFALIDLESNFNQYEVGKDNDRGYFQILPQTEEWLSKTYGASMGIEYNPERIFETEYNVGLGLLYLQHLKRVHKNDIYKILGEYNRGPRGLIKYFKDNGTYVTDYANAILSREYKYISTNF